MGNPLCQPPGASCSLDALFQQQFQSGGLLADQTVKAELTYPAMAVVGLAVKPVKDVSLSADYQWTQWSKWDSVTLHFTNPPSNPAVQQIRLYNQNTTTIRVGANERLEQTNGTVSVTLNSMSGTYVPSTVMMGIE